MMAGCGRAGDFSGDPTEFITPIRALFTHVGLFVFFEVSPELPEGSDLYLYVDGEILSRAAEDEGLYEQGAMPLAVAVVPVGPGIGDDEYDPLCGEAINRFTIEVEDLTPPTGVLTRNAGNGSMEVAWQRPASGVPAYYEIHIGSEAAGDFFQVDRKNYEGLIARVHNLKFGSTIYTKVRAVDVAGNEGPFSDLALDAVVGRARGILRFEGPIGDQIPAGAYFAAMSLDELVGMRVLESGTITG